MQTCSTCKYWLTPFVPTEEQREYDIRPLEYPNPKEGWGQCLLAIGLSGEPKMEATKAFACDVSDYHADLNTKPDFGCNQHAPAVG